MILSGRAVRVWAKPSPTDLRKGFNGLYALVESELRKDPLSGALFLFVNRKRTGCKVLFWDGTGLCILQKRLERGRFAKLWRGGRGPMQLSASELSLFIEGCVVVGRMPLSPKALSHEELAPKPAA